MLVTDQSFTKEQFKANLYQLGSELANRTGMNVKITPFYNNIGQLVGHDVIVDTNNKWLVTHNEANGRVGMMRVFG